MGADQAGIELASAVQSLRDELIEAAARGAGRNVRFTVETIELEFTVELREDTTGKAGVKAWVISAGAEASLGRTNTHRVKLALSARDTTTGRALEIGNPDRGSTSGFTHENPGDDGGS
ncbi:hypothetical protein B4N89_41260 [Embleya scabrispora]|uniref:Trypsin-co-occurring domain-containing protein n=1 Tax=Embleya scabrispora TaxID=159449 RepID=A0A1T3NLI9_9ACTN|nr:trypco2 family protein [Embleya scabrispora]OPC77600.1 hypothetical protein B4N89_41260 [Embleya scabrispora]